MHDILLLRISAILPEAISDGGLTPTTDTDLLLATYRGGSHLTSDINYFIKAIIFLFSLASGNIYYILYVFILIYSSANIRKKIQNTSFQIHYRFLFRFVRLFASIHAMSISCLFFITISNVSRETLEIIIFHRQTPVKKYRIQISHTLQISISIRTLIASIYDISISCLFFITISNVSRETFNIIIFHRQTSFSSAYPVTAPAIFLPSSVLRRFT